MQTPREEWIGAAWRLAIALAATAAALWPSLSGQFVYDDLWLVAQNPAIRSLKTLPAALGGAYWDFIDTQSAARIGYWRPLTAVFQHLGFRLGGGAAWGFHAVSLLLHLGATTAAFFLVRRLVRNVDVAFWSALIFGLHPVHVESVAWISALNDPLHGLFCILAMWTYLRWRERGSPGWSVATPLLFLAALGAKENAVALVPLVAAIDLGRRRAEGRVERMRPLARAWIPMGIALAIYWGMRVMVFGNALAGFERITTIWNLSAARMASLRVEMLGGFLALAAWPAKLNLFREIRPVLPAWDAGFWIAALWIALWCAALVVLLARRSRPALAALLIIVAGVLPALVRIESIGRFPLSDRFLYISVLGIAVLAATAALRFLPGVPAVLALALVCGAAGWRSFERTGFWRSELALFSSAALDNPRSAYVQWSLGRVLLEQFKQTQNLEVLDEAHNAFLRSQEIGKPGAPGSEFEAVFAEDRLQANMGNGWFYLLAAQAGHYRDCTFEEAELVFQAVADKSPSSAEAWTALAVSQLYQDEIEQAEEALQRAIAQNARHFEAWYWLGRLQARAGKPAEAARTFGRALELRPDDRETVVFRAMALGESGDVQAARRLLSGAYAAWPEDAEIMYQLGVLAASQDNLDNALLWFERALGVDGNFGQAYLRRGQVLVRKGDIGPAISSLDRACRSMPSNFEAHYNLGLLLAGNGNPVDALPRIERALSIEPDWPGLRAEVERIRELTKDI
jgi:tetratricopeptide (TPR) repeat protein